MNQTITSEPAPEDTIAPFQSEVNDNNVVDTEEPPAKKQKTGTQLTSFRY